MAGLIGFTDNPFETRPDLVKAATALIKPLERFRSLGGARVKIRPCTVAAFDDVAAQLEGFARPLWAVSAILEDSSSREKDLKPWPQGIQAGVDPESPEFWGNLGACDQRMVEMESMAFVLLAAPGALLLSERSKRNLKAWLWQINEHAMPKNNWRWFRVLVNLALVKVLGTPRCEVEQRVQEDFEVLDSFYLGRGWSSDGAWGEERKQADYYSGSFAIQFAQLLYVRFRDDGDEERVERYRQQAKEFAAKYWRYFDTNGAAIPHGRSMTYRFAFAAFWAAAALAEVELPAPMDSMGAVKGMLLRHLRWWSQHPEIFDSDGVMNVGFTYPNMYLSEDYNSRQSVYWCLKSFIALGLPEDHPFWTCDELPHPLANVRLDGSVENGSSSSVHVNWPPGHILCSSPEHHFLLSSGQMTTKSFKAREAKYGKFAYSSAFAFSVPTGPALHQLAPDSTLSISIDEGETWKVRWQPYDVRIESVPIDGGQRLLQKTVPALVSRWRPFKHLDVEVRTSLIPLADHFPGWHVRAHEVKGLQSLLSLPWSSSLQLVDGSFAIPAYTASGYHVAKTTDSCEGKCDVYHAGRSSVLVKSRAGAGGIVNLAPERANSTQALDGMVSEGLLIEADPNTNLTSPRTFIPSLRHQVMSAPSKSTVSEGETTRRGCRLVSGVFAARGEALTQKDIDEMWERRPKVEFVATELDEPGVVIL